MLMWMMPMLLPAATVHGTTSTAAGMRGVIWTLTGSATTTLTLHLRTLGISLTLIILASTRILQIVIFSPYGGTLLLH
jgi:hypothetical protein